MSRKRDVHERYGTSSSLAEEPLRNTAPPLGTKATNEHQGAAFNKSPPEISAQFKTLRRRMWIGVVCMIIATVALIKLLP